jgi:hypothetical protein
VPESVVEQANVQLASGAEFISNDQLETAMQDAGASQEVTQAVVETNEQARVDGLRSALALLAIIGTVGLLFTRRIPTEQPGAGSTAADPV